MDVFLASGKVIFITDNPVCIITFDDSRVVFDSLLDGVDDPEHIERWETREKKEEK